jgi:putative membrane protein
MLGVIALAVYAVRRIGPAATRPGEVIVSRGHKLWFVAGVLTLWLAIDWPMHDIAEEYLYFVHMIQHLLLSFVVAPVLLLATPTWLARMVVGKGLAYTALRKLTRLIPATLLFNAVVVFSHWPAVVNNVVGNGPLHYGVHVLVVFSAVVLWLPVCGPLPELRYSLGVQMPYLFLQSIIPTVPAGWLTFAEGVVYKSYDHTYRLWGISVAYDQQAAGMIMKVVGGTFLWAIIAVLFVRFAQASELGDHVRGIQPDRRAPAEDLLTWADVEKELATAPPAPEEP